MVSTRFDEGNYEQLRLESAQYNPLAKTGNRPTKPVGRGSLVQCTTLVYLLLYDLGHEYLPDEAVCYREE